MIAFIRFRGSCPSQEPVPSSLVAFEQHTRATRQPAMVLGLFGSSSWNSLEYEPLHYCCVEWLLKSFMWHAYRTPESCPLQAVYRAWPHLEGSSLLSCRLRQAGHRGREGRLSWAVRHGPVPSCCCLYYLWGEGVTSDRAQGTVTGQPCHRGNTHVYEML